MFLYNIHLLCQKQPLAFALVQIPQIFQFIYLFSGILACCVNCKKLSKFIVFVPNHPFSPAVGEAGTLIPLGTEAWRQTTQNSMWG